MLGFTGYGAAGRRRRARPMAVVVMKFGGTSVANVERIKNVARHVKREVDAGNQVAVVVSAMSGVTNQLVAWVREASVLHDAREYDAIVASGEMVTPTVDLGSLRSGLARRAPHWHKSGPMARRGRDATAHHEASPRQLRGATRAGRIDDHG